MKYRHDPNSGENIWIFHVIRALCNRVWFSSVRLTQHLFWKKQNANYVEHKTAHIQMSLAKHQKISRIMFLCLTFPLKYIQTGKSAHTHVKAFLLFSNKSNWIESHSERIDSLHELCILILVPIEFIDGME